ncbi:MAG: hypothetical protein ACKVIH_06865 [Burkholderiales bacterium]
MSYPTLPARTFFFGLMLLAASTQLQAQSNDKRPLETNPNRQAQLPKSEQSKLPEEGLTSPGLYDAGTQRIERIRIEDGGSRVDELRYGGVVERIVVQPKFDVPAYEILPNDKVTSRPRGRDGAPPTHAQRVWNVLGF